MEVDGRRQFLPLGRIGRVEVEGEAAKRVEVPRPVMVFSAPKAGKAQLTYLTKGMGGGAISKGLNTWVAELGFVLTSAIVNFVCRKFLIFLGHSTPSTPRMNASLLAYLSLLETPPMSR
jgi:hypothetical protein